MRSAVKTRLSQRQTANTYLNLAADDRRIERSNHAGVIVSNIENIIRLFLEAAFKIHLAQKSEVRAPSLWMGMTPLTLPLHACEGLMSRFYKLLVWSL